LLRRARGRGIIGIFVGMFLACLNVSSPAQASEPCPSAVLTYWFMFHGGDTYVPTAAFDTTIVNSDSDTARVAFDHGAGRMTLSAVGRVWAGERVRERFDVSGVPVGTPVPAIITFALDGDVLNNCGGGGCGAYFTATLATTADSVIADASIPGPCDSCTRRLSTTLTLPLTITSGTPVEVAFARRCHVRIRIAERAGGHDIPNGIRSEIQEQTLVGSCRPNAERRQLEGRIKRRQPRGADARWRQFGDNRGTESLP